MSNSSILALIVDDDIASRLFIQKSVAKLGYPIATAQNGDEAWEIYRERRPEIIISDWMMPQMDGIELCRRIRAEPEAYYCYFILLTSRSERQDFREGIKVGTDDFLNKPLDLEQLEARMRTASRMIEMKRKLLSLADSLLDGSEQVVAERTQKLAATNEQLRQEMARRQQMEIELRHAQKLEAVGQLASGIAHEINTPIQFVGDSVHFLRGAFSDLGTVLSIYDKLYEKVALLWPDDPLLAEIGKAREEADLEYLQEQVPRAFERTVDGIDRVSGIVRAMKEFAHPSHKDKAAADLNRMIVSTLTVARNEYKYVAEIETDLGPVPPLMCHAGDLNQVILNLVVNAAHAIGDVVKGTPNRGTIRVSTEQEGPMILLSIADTGGGIPEGIRSRIFEPFFTTKEVGRGTGQGLAIARSIVVERHGGTLTFDTQIGKGTTFVVRLPIDSEPPAPAAPTEDGR